MIFSWEFYGIEGFLWGWRAQKIFLKSSKFSFVVLAFFWTSSIKKWGLFKLKSGSMDFFRDGDFDYQNLYGFHISYVKWAKKYFVLCQEFLKFSGRSNVYLVNFCLIFRFFFKDWWICNWIWLAFIFKETIA